MKFSQMPYERPDAQALERLLEAETQRLASAGSFAEADAAFLRVQEALGHLETMDSIASIRHDVNTLDPFYEAEVQNQAKAQPILQKSKHAWNQALLDSPFLKDFARKYGPVPFQLLRMEFDSFSPEIVEEMQEENQLKIAYTNLIASAQIDFAGKTYTIAQLGPFKQDPDDAKRRAAWEAEGGWYAANGGKLDEIYDKLVKVRTRMARKLGFDNYIPLGYLRMQRNGYGKEDVEAFRAAVEKHLVPVAEEVCRRQAARTGAQYPLSFPDEALFFRQGNARPVGTPEEILEMGRKFYHELSPETKAFIDVMLEGELMDVNAKKGKAGGGYCTTLPDYKVPFIFSNFNGTQHDVEVITHEAGHAFAAFTARDIVPYESQWPTLESCEIHSMSMEFFSWPWAEGFFGPQADRFRYKHLSDALTFIPYGCMVDHFQHIVYEQPELTPQARHEAWRGLLKRYMPWMRLDRTPFYGEGKGWQRQQHIYRSPFYYIDYCLAQTVALQFWALIQKDLPGAWKRYMDLVRLAGTRTFRELVAAAGLEVPFHEGALKDVAAAAGAWLDAFPEGALK
jgi:M3 family oligoendopeptidase